MGILLSLLIGMITGVLGLFCAGFFATLYVDWYQVTSREGASGYFIVFIALVGGFIASLLGFIVSGFFLFGNEPHFLKALSWSVVLVLSISGMAIGIAYSFADIPPKLNGATLMLHLEFRLPKGQSLNTAPDSTTSLVLGSVVGHVQRASQNGQLHLDQARYEEDRWIVPGEVDLFTGRGLRSIHAELDGESIGSFIVPLPSHPGQSYLEWSKWGPQTAPNDPTVPLDKNTYRFRVQPSR
jgi:hypothetical protein